MSWKDEIRKEAEPFDLGGDDKESLIGITKELLERIESGLDSLSVTQLEDLYDALDDASKIID